ncbi:hypothetical protein OG241_22560 [Streptomyces sp. NBC_01390]|uniref:hypothetical protein n=1 Tax=Streptomyces sp. NBC_01390 TaxID=2903850 RepID=UPI00324F9F65
MDAGMAAVLGALAGSVGTMGAAFAAGRAQRAGAEIAARAEHRKNRRDPRQAAYKELIDAALALAEWEYYDDEPNQDAELEPYLLRIQKAYVDVALAGPARVAKPADKLYYESALYKVTVRERAKANFETPHRWVTDVNEKIFQHLADFMSAAQSALDDDGSRRRFRR